MEVAKTAGTCPTRRNSRATRTQSGQISSLSKTGAEDDEYIIFISLLSSTICRILVLIFLNPKAQAMVVKVCTSLAGVFFVVWSNPDLHAGILLPLLLSRSPISLVSSMAFRDSLELALGFLEKESLLLPLLGLKAGSCSCDFMSLEEDAVVSESEFSIWSSTVAERVGDLVRVPGDPAGANLCL